MTRLALVTRDGTRVESDPVLTSLAGHWRLRLELVVRALGWRVEVIDDDDDGGDPDTGRGVLVP